MKIFIFVFLCMIVVFGCSVNKQNILTQSNESFAVSKNISKSELTNLGKGWFKVTESVVIENITPEEAKDRAIQRACKKAIEYFSGIEVSGRVINIQAENQDKILIDNFSSITQQTAQGIIIEKEILKNEILSKGNQLLKVITIKVKVDKQKGEKDPSFVLNPEINREHFKDGEEMELSI
jgi:hypothetical protein